MTMGLKCFLFILVTIYLRGTAVLGQNEPRITKHILPEIKKAGMTGMLNCTVTNQLDNKVNWIHQDSNKIITNDNDIDVDDIFNPIIDGNRKYDVRMFQQGELKTYQLIVRRLQLTDAGTYVCKINIRGNDKPDPTKTGKMIVMLPPTIIQSQTTQTINVDEGSNANLTCNATGYPKPNVTWVRPNGKDLPPPYNRYSYRGNTLLLTNIGFKDRGVYRCLADNNVRPPATYDATLYVNFRPTARAVQSTYGQAQNRMFDLIIECLISGYPEPELRWYKRIGTDGKQPIGDDDYHRVYTHLAHSSELSISEYWFQLKIINVRANDYGTYSCEGFNNRGRGSALIQVFETSECQGPSCVPEQSFIGAAVSVQVSFLLMTSLSLLTWLLH